MSGKESKVIVTFAFLVGISFVFIISTFYSTFSLDNVEYSFESLVYEIDEEYISNISPDTSVELFYKYFDLENCHIEVSDINGGKIGDNSLITNGSKTVIYDNNNIVIKTYTNIIKGDFNNDGIIDNSDFEKMGKCLVEGCSLENYQMKSLDIDYDGEFHINDLLILDKIVTKGYDQIVLKDDTIVLQSEEKGRLVASVTPDYGLGQNFEWSSEDDSIATVDETGKVTGHNEGEVVIKVSTKDGKISSSATVKVDNTIQLYSYQGIGYVGGDDVKVKIKSIDYEGITCSSSNEANGTCTIDGEYLVMKPRGQGKTVVTVISPKYGQVTYELESKPVFITFQYKMGCNIKFGWISTTNAGNLIFESDNSEVLVGAHLAKTTSGSDAIVFDYGKKGGRATLKVKASTNGLTKEIIIDHSIISIPEMYRFTKVGEEITTAITGDNLGELSCSSNKSSVATCEIKDDQLIVKTLALGSADITVSNTFTYEGGWPGNCGSAQFSVFVQE